MGFETILYTQPGNGKRAARSYSVFRPVDWWQHVPLDIDGLPTRGLPIVINPPNGRHPRWAEELDIETLISTEADTFGYVPTYKFIAIFPFGINRATTDDAFGDWNSGHMHGSDPPSDMEDVHFVETLIDREAAKLARDYIYIMQLDHVALGFLRYDRLVAALGDRIVDRNRIFAVGHSEGSAFTHRLAKDSDTFAAVCVSSGWVGGRRYGALETSESDNSPFAPHASGPTAKSILRIHGRDDNQVELGPITTGNILRPTQHTLNKLLEWGYAEPDAIDLARWDYSILYGLDNWAAYNFHNNYVVGPTLVDFDLKTAEVVDAMVLRTEFIGYYPDGTVNDTYSVVLLEDPTVGHAFPRGWADPDEARVLAPTLAPTSGTINALKWVWRFFVPLPARPSVRTPGLPAHTFAS